LSAHLQSREVPTAKVRRDERVFLERDVRWVCEKMRAAVFADDIDSTFGGHAQNLAGLVATDEQRVISANCQTIGVRARQ